MGLLKTEDWRGVWICAPVDTEALLRRQELTVKQSLQRALAHVTGVGRHEMFVKGAKAGDDLLSHGWTDYSSTILIDTI